ncbi:MAG TPA: hypothetical protein VGI16_11360 [Candidatus Acidoferrum sp.]|jgi:hypothetical protein
MSKSYFVAPTQTVKHYLESNRLPDCAYLSLPGGVTAFASWGSKTLPADAAAIGAEPGVTPLPALDSTTQIGQSIATMLQPLSEYQVSILATDTTYQTAEKIAKVMQELSPDGTGYGDDPTPSPMPAPAPVPAVSDDHVLLIASAILASPVLSYSGVGPNERTACIADSVAAAKQILGQIRKVG